MTNDTPKQKAEEILYLAIHTITEGYWLETSDETEANKKKVQRQILKIANRLAKVLHYEPKFSLAKKV